MSGNLKLTGPIAKLAKKTLRTVCGTLDEHKIPYVLEGGTLLGIVRENRLLPWDNDVDITITEEQLERLMQLEERFNKEVYILKQRKSQEDMPHFPIGTVRLVKVKKKKLIGKNIGILDIFVKRRVGDKYFWIVGQTGNVLKSVAYHYYEKLGRYPFDGYEYSVPAEYEDYLTCRYGDWRKTVKDYNFKKDDQSIVNA